MQKQKARAISLGGFNHVESITIGGDVPVVIQTMWKDRLSFADLEGTQGEAIIARITNLKAMGCALLRCAVPDMESADVVGHLAEMVSMPLVADIHFDYRIALRCLDFPIAKIRINPGNIGTQDKVKAVLSKAAAKGRPIRIGVNAGSLPLDLRRAVTDGKLDRAMALVEAAERELALCRELAFTHTIVSVKASSIADTIAANRLLRTRTDTPIHIGVTEAGPLIAGVVRSTAALYTLLTEGIGDTMRVSLSDTMEREVIACREILAAVSAVGGGTGSAPPGVTIVSCPRCGRHSFDTHGFVERWQPILYGIKKHITVAVMGCAVNGPEEARHADLGITGVGTKVLLFSHGTVIQTISAENADAAFEEALKQFV